MAATDARGGAGSPGPRRFVTRQHVEDAALSGSPVVLRGRDVLTDEAAQRAEDLGVRIDRERATGSASGPATAPAGPPTTQADVRGAVRKAVVAELGREPDGLAAAIDRVMRRRGL